MNIYTLGELMKKIRCLALLLAVLVLSACGGSYEPETTVSIESTQNIITTETTTLPITTEETTTVVSENSIPEYSGSPYIILNNNKPEFTEAEITSKAGIGKGTAYEYFSDKDEMIAKAIFYHVEQFCNGLYEEMQKENGLYRIYSNKEFFASIFAKMLTTITKML